ncbi:riboflavin synthase [bacterium]|nr:riboflavin synthase [bacterium]
MFTGLIEEKGKITRLNFGAEIISLSILAPGICSSDIKPGDSIAVSGICLTVIKIKDLEFTVQVVPETIQRTILPDWKAGDQVNLERSLTLGGRLDGHLVAGHVDGTGTVIAVKQENGAQRLELQFPENLSRFIAEKGSVALNGVSLTVAEIMPNNRFAVALIPYTLSRTNLEGLAPGKQVNLEVDLLARYLERLNTAQIEKSGLTIEKLAETGYL